MNGGQSWARDPARIRRAIFGACRRRGIDDETRRAVQLRATGKESLKDMTPREMAEVLQALGGWRRRQLDDSPRRRGPGPPSGVGEPKPREVLPAGPHRSKLRALWICAYELGVVRDRTDDALAAWICRQTGLDAAVWATPAQTSACIEALKDWMARDGGVCWEPYARSGKRPVHNPRARVLEALWRKLHEVGAVRIADHGALHSWVVGFRRSQESYSALPSTIQDQLIRELGKWLRKASR